MRELADIIPSSHQVAATREDFASTVLAHSITLEPVPATGRQDRNRR
jgi:hypothetical protein